MKILILANNQQNVDAIKAEISKDIKSADAVHEVNDVVRCTYLGGNRTIDWETDDPKNKIDETEYGIVFIYHRLIINQVPFGWEFKNKSYVALWTESFVF